MAAGGGVPSAALKDELTAYLTARAQPGVSVTVSGYQRLGFQLKVSLRVRSDAFDTREVKAAVGDALIAAFTEQARGLGQPLYRGELFRVIDGVSGVENSDCRIILPAATQGRLAQVGVVGGEVQAARPGPRQCLVFDPTGFELEVQEYRL